MAQLFCRICSTPVRAQRKYCSLACWNLSKKLTIIDNATQRFWQKVDKSGDCWQWQDSLDKCGRGQFGMGQKKITASRMAWMLTHGTIPADKCVCHTCDNPRCVNPSHLFLGTRKENSVDMSRKGRSARGEGNHQSKLTASQVQEILKLHFAGSPQFEIARKFGVSHGAVSLIVRGKTWKHLSPTFITPGAAGSEASRPAEGTQP